jgi:predicted ATPase/Tfp pilus assembly protein PilF
VRLTTLGGLTLEGSDFTRPKPLLLLCYLALEGPQERRFLAELFWPTAADHMKSLTVALAQLRGGAEGAIEADQQRVSTPLASDAGELLALLEQRRADAAIERYRGAFLEGFYLKGVGEELEEWIYVTREFLAERVRGALQGVGLTEAGRGDFARGAQRATAALALRGAAPPEPDDLVQLHTLLLAGEHPRAREARDEAEGFGLPLAASAAEAQGRLRSEPEPLARTLPERGSSFVGRDPERTEIGGLITSAGVPLLTLVGPAGVGKTRLALQVAREQQRLGAFADGVGFVGFDAVNDPRLIAQRAAAALGLDLGPDDSLEALARRIGERSPLLLIDNFEHLIGAATQLATLLAACPGLTLLVTSRERLNLEEERIFPIEGLSLPATELPLEEARRHDAVHLFVQRALSARPDFELTPEALPHVLEITRLVEGLPLGLELAAVWVRVLSCREIAAELSQSLDLLTTSTRNVPDRHRSIRGAFEHSWELLTPREQRVLAELAAFRGGFRREAAGEVAGATIPLLASLVDKSLLRLGPGGRYDRHPLLYQYSAEKLAGDPGTEAAAQERHAHHMIAFLEERNEALRGPNHREALQALSAETANLRRAWRWALAGRSHTDLRRLSEPLATLFDTRNAFREGVELLSEAHAALDGDDPEGATTLGTVLAAASALEYRLGRYADAEASARRALSLLAPADAWRARARSHNTLGGIGTRTGDFGDAKERFERAVETARRQGDPHDIARYVNNLAMAEQMLGDYDDARRHLQEALDLKRAQNDQRFVIRNLNNLGNLALYLGDRGEAGRYFREGLQLAEELEVSEIIPYFHVNLGIVLNEAGRYPEAERMFAAALDEARESGNRPLEIGARRRLGNVGIATGRFEEAEEHLLAALAIARELNGIPAQLLTLLALAQLRAKLGLVVEALELCGTILNHGGIDVHERERAQGAADAIREAIDDAGAEAALARGAQTPLDTLTDTLLADREAKSSGVV